jgi:transcriptional activator for dhaKLM operon
MRARLGSAADALGPAALEILDAISDGVVVTDAARRIVWLNRSAADRLGLSLADVAGRPACEALHEGCDGACALEAGESQVIRYRASTNMARLDVEATCRRIADAGGRIVATVEVFGPATRPRDEAQPLPLVGSSAAIREVLEFVAEAACAHTPVLVTGEPGVGKGAVARAIHGAGRRAVDRFATYDCALRDARDLSSIAKSLCGGAPSTLYLHRVERLTHAGQQALRTILDGCRAGDTARPQVIASTRADLEAIVDRGAFDRELFYEINATALRVPALRERPADLPHLVARQIDELNEVSRTRSVESVEPEALDLLVEYEYPDNVRELVQIVEHAFAKCRGKQIRLRHLPERLLAPAADAEPEGAEEISDSIEMLERDFMLRVLTENRWRLNAVAEQLGLSRTTLWRKLKRLGIENPRRSER